MMYLKVPILVLPDVAKDRLGRLVGQGIESPVNQILGHVPGIRVYKQAQPVDLAPQANAQRSGQFIPFRGG